MTPSCFISCAQGVGATCARQREGQATESQAGRKTRPHIPSTWASHRQGERGLLSFDQAVTRVSEGCLPGEASGRSPSGPLAPRWSPWGARRERAWCKLCSPPVRVRMRRGFPFSLDVVQLHGLSQNASRCCLAVVGGCDSKMLSPIFNPVECATVAGSVAFNKGTLAAFASVAFGWAGPPAAGSVWPSGIWGVLTSPQSLLAQQLPRNRVETEEALEFALANSEDGCSLSHPPSGARMHPVVMHNSGAPSCVRSSWHRSSCPVTAGALSGNRPCAGAQEGHLR